jgi:uncharacterized protein YdaT
MADTTSAPNNRTIIYRSKTQRERPRVPWSGKSFGSRHNHSLSGAGAAKAASIANAVLKRSGDEGMAIAVANKKVAGMRKRGRISDRAYAKHSAGLDSDRDVDAATA